MRSAIGTALLSNIIIFFLVVMLVFLVGSFSYSKAYRIKNSLLNTIERDQGFIEDNANLILSQIGYRIVNNTTLSCPDRRGTPNGPYPKGLLVSGSKSGKYRYCVYEHFFGTNPSGDGVYVYVVTTYMYFDIPLLGSVLEFPITGETKTIYKKS